MKAEQYAALAAWFNARPVAKNAFGLFCKASVAVVYLSYAALLAVMAWQRSEHFLAVLCVPAFVFVTGSVLRAAINRPRPYQTLDFTPLFPKNTLGKSMPSRHCFSAAAVAVATGTICLPLGVALAVLAACIAVSRVISGVHYPTDVVVGLCYGAALTAAGLWVFTLL